MSILNIRSVGDEIGQASTLKMCFASLTKGLTALAVQSFATASRMDMLAELREEVAAFAPGWVEYLERSLGLVPGKAYRWVTEMENIKDTHRETGFEEDVFRGVAEVYRFVSEETVLGKGRVWGRSADEVVRDVGGSLKKKRGLEEVEDVEDSGGNSEKRARIDGEEVETS